MDCETTGLDLFHGARPFMVTACSDSGRRLVWEWPVDPLTRTPIIPREDVRELRSFIANKRHTFVLHNAKFDIRALSTIIPGLKWPWDRTHDTLLASHCLDSYEDHGLKPLALKYLGMDDDDEQALNTATNQARAYGRKHGWRIAEPGDDHHPGLRRAPNDGWWKLDTWLPAAVVSHALANHQQTTKKAKPGKGLDKFTGWDSVCRTYAIRDVERTIGLWILFQREVSDARLWDQYNEQLRIMRITYRMESEGVTLRPAALRRSIGRFEQQAEHHRRSAISLSRSTRPINIRSNNDIQQVLYGEMGAPVVKRNKTGPASDKTTLTTLLGMDIGERPTTFIKHLLSYRESLKAKDYLDAYESSAHSVRVPFNIRGKVRYIWIPTLRPWFNPTGTSTTRLSSSNPNAQNVGKSIKPCIWCDEAGCEYCDGSGFSNRNIRAVFGPTPGTVWFANDYSNVELRLVAYAAEEKDLIAAFDRGESVHMIVARELWGSEAEAPNFKETDKYRWTKNFSFAVVYGATRSKADATAHLPGAYDRIIRRFKGLSRLMASISDQVRQQGYVHTLGGYRLTVPRDKPYVGLNYFIQGSAGQICKRAMILCDDYIRRLRTDHAAYLRLPRNQRPALIMNVHDELVFRFPDCFEPTHIAEIKRLMEKPGYDLGIPTPVDVDIVRRGWDSGESHDPAAACAV